MDAVAGISIRQVQPLSGIRFLLFGEQGDEQGTAGKTDADCRDSRPLKMMPEGSGQEGTCGSSQEISGHEDGIHPVGCLRSL